MTFSAPDPARQGLARQTGTLALVPFFATDYALRMTPRLQAILAGAGLVFDLGGTTSVVLPRVRVRTLYDDGRAVSSDLRFVAQDMASVIAQEYARPR